ncbi:Rieske (2Fe-2S) protein [Streptomyces sp. VRA16 Mangrove soil]|uniref:Rieske (2Fe-2S) protein n=1 Tax=Streptomyces sp. VRA16 Mangrove soil TaxID=2817434 RepID=UPI001A9F39F1|nr:Rieske (2Fe-2S) protein [Streptomyces sp. VRA16 Mangrove soil]MBO1337292.1 Rieske (2Fe-2S) protein [Streptomyces sp. VRA16 Mangrove soil]
MTVSHEAGPTDPTGTTHPDGVAPSRRTVVAAVGAAGLAAALTACGSSDDGGGSEPAGNASAAGGGALAKTADIPEGGGKIFADQGVVVTQPTKGQFKAFSSTCTHQGCKVSKIEGGTIDCPCHGSKFSIEDGSVKHPPATQPLPAKQITVSGDSISLA